MHNVFVLTYGSAMTLLGVFETFEKAQTHVAVSRIGGEVNFRPIPYVMGLGQWTWDDYTITELPVR